jgi:hypothetical protein
VEELLNQAERLEKEYGWLGAAESYEKALKLLPEDDFSRKAETYERLGYAFYRAAFQAQNNDEFRQRLRQATADYEKAKELYQSLNERKKTGIVFRCDAMNAYMDYWSTSEASAKKKLLNKCWELTKRALEAFDAAGAALDYGKTFNQLSMSVILEFTLESNFQARTRIMKEAVECGEKATKFLSLSDDISELARAYARTVVCLNVFGYYCQDIHEREPSCQKALDYWHKAKELSEETAIMESLCPVFGGQPVFGLEGSNEALENYGKGLEYAEKTGDRFFIGCALDWLAYHTQWGGGHIEEKDESAMRALYKTVMQYSEDARAQFSRISFTSPRADAAWIESPSVVSNFYLANIETDVKKKRDLLEKTRKAAPDMMKKAENSGYPEAINYAHMMFGAILYQLARMETNREERKKLLEQALHHSKEFVVRIEQVAPLLYFNRGYSQGTLARTKADIAEIAEDYETKKSLLQEAALDMDSALKLVTEEVTFFENKQSSSSGTTRWVLSGFQFGYGSVLNRLYSLTRNQEYLEKAMEAFRESAESYQKLNLRSRMAECRWKIAQAYDAMGEHSSAAQQFSLASNDYKSAGEKIPQLKGFYQDHACYMEAWSEIEKARHHHKRQEYGLAEEHFQNAANMHKSLKQWSYLAPNYSAWAMVERAEELSRKDQSEEAFQAFEQATGLFEETKKSVQDQLSKIEDADEKQMATQVSRATDSRREYCRARIAIEEAKILDKKGDHYTSSEKYCSAAATIQKTLQTTESEEEKKELTLISTLSLAWAKMTSAEAEGSPDLYVEASKLFEEAKKFSANERTKMLALGHSRFCRALEAGTKFIDTRDTNMHTAAIHHLESAATYYVKADFPMASEYAKATELLFDAYAQMDKAKEERDPEKRAKLYILAEKMLQTSAGAYMKSEHPEKNAQLQRLLEKVREEQELATSLTEVLHAPTIVSTTTAFTTPTPNKEEAVGLERFEHADVQANLIVRQKELKVGENLGIELELVNAGKGSALLTKVTEIVPKGFEVAEKPENCRVEDSYINLKGKRLDPLKTEEVKLVLKPNLQGTFSLKPTVLYLDENGKYKSHEPEPVTIVVKELGIKGWLKGER